MSAVRPGVGVRPRYSSNPLIRLLGQRGMGEVPELRRTVAEDLSQWLAWTDAIALSSALQPVAAAPGGQPAADAAGAAEAVAQLSEALARAIPATPPPDAGTGGDFAPWRRQYLAQQRRMAERIGALRSQLRTVLARQSPALAQLAALDAVMDQALAGRERQLLAELPGRLAQGFADRQAAATGDTDAAPWQATLAQDLRQLLLAELDLRLQPVQGLLQALQQDNTLSTR
jgi:Protein of unknown function (DUF3348)